MLRVLKKLLFGALMVFGAFVIVMLAVDRWGPKPAAMVSSEPVRLDLAPLCVISFDLDRARWVRDQYLQNTYRLRGQGAGREVALHVYGAYPGEPSSEAECGKVEALRTETLPTGVAATYRLAECPQVQRGIGPQPGEPRRLYASVDGKFYSWYLVAGGADRTAVLAQQEHLRAMVNSLRTGDCTDLAQPLR